MSVDQVYSYNQIRRLNASGVSSQRITDSREGAHSPSQRLFLDAQYALRQKNLAEICRHYLMDSHQVLEVGSGMISASGRSFLTESFPLNIAARVTYCDANPECRVENVDLVTLDDRYPHSFFSHVIGSNVLDTLNRRDLSQAVEKIYNVLQPNGVVVHCLNIEPFVYAFLHDLAMDYAYAVPFLNSKGAHEAFVFDKWEEMSIEQKEIVFHTMLKKPDKAWLDKLRDSNEKIVSSFDQYVQKLHSLLIGKGFEIVKEDYFSNEDILISPGDIPLGGQKVVCSPAGVETAKDANLASNQVAIQMKTHLLVAKKK